ncbi:NADH--cytochrome b5 reductase 1 [Camellia lanceoleosa]|uniref:NADH--cytochrome b5 reductase 1 n=1 Tax=Camellia lanceoleosa TaxID=1840588 RepID=A0ACC0GTB7_9ERIC|nr:NADH--cytochrome b5 reductase 1 [Camellia lanceoleosa]
MTTYHQIIMILMMSPLKVLRTRHNCLAFGDLGLLLSIVRFGFVASLGQEKPIALRFYKKGRFKCLLGQVRAFGMLAGGIGITPMFQSHYFHENID